MPEQKLYFGGVPTGPDVKKLDEALGVPEPGLIKHETIEKIIGEARGSSRYRSVVGSWRRKLLRTSNVRMRPEPGVGLVVMTGNERVEESIRGLRHGARHVVREGNLASSTPVGELDDPHRRMHEHLMRYGTELGEAAIKATTDLRKALKAPAQLPPAAAE